MIEADRVMRKRNFNEDEIVKLKCVVIR